MFKSASPGITVPHLFLLLACQLWDCQDYFNHSNGFHRTYAEFPGIWASISIPQGMAAPGRTHRHTPMHPYPTSPPTTHAPGCTHCPTPPGEGCIASAWWQCSQHLGKAAWWERAAFQNLKMAMAALDPCTNQGLNYPLSKVVHYFSQ